MPLAGRGAGVLRLPSMAAIACIGVEFLEPAEHPGAQARIWFLDATGQVQPVPLTKQAPHLGRRPLGTITAAPDRQPPRANADRSAPLGGDPPRPR